MQLVRIVLIVFLSMPFAYAKQPDLEYKIKAAYLYNFTKFITWPDHGFSTFNLCILGDDPFGSVLHKLEQKSVHDRPIKLHYLSSAKQAEPCHILYIDNDADLLIPNLNVSKQRLQNTAPFINTLTVSSQAYFAHNGGMIGFTIRDGRVKLEINPEVLKKAGLNISAKLLEIADLVKGYGP